MITSTGLSVSLFLAGPAWHLVGLEYEDEVCLLIRDNAFSYVFAYFLSSLCSFLKDLLLIRMFTVTGDGNTGAPKISKKREAIGPWNWAARLC